MYMYIYYIIVGGMFAKDGLVCMNPPLSSMHNRVQLYQIGPFYAIGLMGIISNKDVALYHRWPSVHILELLELTNYQGLQCNCSLV